MTEAKKDASVKRVKEAVYDSVSVSEEGKNYVDRESAKTGSGKKAPEFVEYTKVYKDERIAKSGDSFWQNTGSQYLVFSQKLNESTLMCTNTGQYCVKRIRASASHSIVDYTSNQHTAIYHREVE